MDVNQINFSRGAEWRQWDLHIHTPASFHWDGQRFDPNPNSPVNTKIVDEMISALNAAEPAVFALMDYWTFDGWFALKKRLSEVGAPELKKMVFPGIELRLMAPMNGRLNAHVLFSNEIDDQVLQDFKSALNVEIIDRPLSNDALMKLARMVGKDKLEHHCFKNDEVVTDDDVALRAGSTIAEINCDSYKSAIEKVPSGQAIGFMPFDTSDGLSKVKWQEHYAYVLGLFKSSPIFETRNDDLRGAFVGEETIGNAEWIENFQHCLSNTHRLAVSGSDAHRFIGVNGDNDKRGYGDFPSGKATWIKADPTFLGLLQTIKEPAKRSHIGERPVKLREVEANKTFYINSVEVNKAAGSSMPEEWLAGCHVELNHDLVAIIGNKGSGKSALADVIALMGNSQQKEHFSFLQKNRFRGKSGNGDPAKQFIGKIEWLDSSREERRLSDDPPGEKVQLVRYIPQGHFEDLCNDHISGHTGAFEKELRGVIFDYAGGAIRLGALDFDQLIEQQESGYRDQLGEYRKDLTRLNSDIENIEEQCQPQVKMSLQEMLLLKRRQIDEHNSADIKPVVLSKPADALSAEQKKAANSLDKITEQLRTSEEDTVANTRVQENAAAKLKSIQNVQERLRTLEKQFKQFEDDTSEDLKILDIKSSEIVTLTVNRIVIDKVKENIPLEQHALLEKESVNEKLKAKLLKEQLELNAKLNEPQLIYQKNLKDIEIWEEKLRELTGAPSEPESLKGIENRIAQLDELPSRLNEKEARRLEITGDIFDILDSQRKSREDLFKPVQDLIQGNKLIIDEYKLQFQATLGGSSEVLSSELFSLMKQNSGEFRGEDESPAVIKRLTEEYDLSKKSDVLNFCEEINKKIHVAASGTKTNSIGIASIMRKDKPPRSVYDLLYGLTYLEPRYSLLFQDTKIEQLSPGQRGALLLIFYLLVDKGRNPIILDQPEENLDNETVVSLLVPVLSEAKKCRQIIMVTHNPNLAVVCDAEQIIYSSFDRKNASKIDYVSGSIENPMINRHVIDVLEGTKPAFNNRKIKYH